MAARRRGRGEGSIYRRKDGRWVGQYEVGGKRRYVYGKTRKEAASKMTKAVADGNEGLIFDSDHFTLAQYLDRCLHDTRPGKPLTLGCAYHDTMVGRGSSGGGGEEGSTGRAAIGYDHGYDGEVFYLGLALDERYVEGWVEGCLERIGEDDPDEEQLFRDLWEDETQREVVIESLQADCEVRSGRPPSL